MFIAIALNAVVGLQTGNGAIVGLETPDGDQVFWETELLSERLANLHKNCGQQSAKLLTHLSGDRLHFRVMKRCRRSPGCAVRDT